jgi:hypothetical protein
VLGDEHCSAGIGDVMAAEADLLVKEYQEVNAHLRANMTQFVNWFSFFLTFSFVAAAIVVVATTYRPELHGLGLDYGVPIVFLLMHILAFIGILTFRRYITAAHCEVEAIIKRAGGIGGSPIPVRFCRWMTDLMAAGFVISYFTWLALLFVR